MQCRPGAVSNAQTDEPSSLVAATHHAAAGHDCWRGHRLATCHLCLGKCEELATMDVIVFLLFLVTAHAYCTAPRRAVAHGCKLVARVCP